MAICLRVVSNPLGNVYQKKLTEKGSNPIVINAITYSLLAIACVPLSFVFNFTQTSSEFWIISVVIGLLGALGNSFLIKALQNGELSVLGPINSYKAVIGLFFAAILLKEFPNFYGILGMILIIWGSYFIFDTLEEKFSLKLLKRKDIQYRFLALFFTSLEAVFIKKLVVMSSVIDAFISWCFFGALFSVIIVLILRPDLTAEKRLLRKRHASFYLNIAVCVAIMQYTTNYILARMNVGYALSLFQLSCIVSIFFGCTIFNEKNIRKKLLGTVIMIAGAVLIILMK